MTGNSSGLNVGQAQNTPGLCAWIVRLEAMGELERALICGCGSFIKSEPKREAVVDRAFGRRNTGDIMVNTKFR